MRLGVSPRGGSTHTILSDLDAGGEPHEVAIMGAKRHAADHLPVDGIGQRRLAAHGDALPDDNQFLDIVRGRGVQFKMKHGRLVEQHSNGHRSTRACGRPEGHTVVARNELGESEPAVGVRDRRSRPWHDVVLGDNGDSGER